MNEATRVLSVNAVGGGSVCPKMCRGSGIVEMGGNRSLSLESEGKSVCDGSDSDLGKSRCLLKMS